MEVKHLLGDGGDDDGGTLLKKDMDDYSGGHSGINEPDQDLVDDVFGDLIAFRTERRLSLPSFS